MNENYLDRDVVDVIVTELLAEFIGFVGIHRLGDAGALLPPGKVMMGVLLQRFKLLLGSKSIFSGSV